MPSRGALYTKIYIGSLVPSVVGLWLAPATTMAFLNQALDVMGVPGGDINRFPKCETAGEAGLTSFMGASVLAVFTHYLLNSENKDFIRNANKVRMLFPIYVLGGVLSANIPRAFLLFAVSDFFSGLFIASVMKDKDDQD